MNNKQQHILPFWARICAVGLLYLFIHFTVLLPYLNSDIGIINLTELCDEENEGEKEEIETEKEFEIITFQFKLKERSSLYNIDSFNTDYQLLHYSEVTTPPPELS